MNPSTPIDVRSAVGAEFVALAELLDPLPDTSWDTPSLCAGWRVREVVAHLTMPMRYSTAQFGAELADCDGDFTRLSNLLANRDGVLPVSTLVANLRDEMMHHWTPPGGGPTGALNHVVIHGLDITEPLGVARRTPDETMGAVLDDLTVGGTHAHFGFDLGGLSLRATDLDWTFGTGALVAGTAADLALMICGRHLPAGRIQRELAPTHGA